MLIQYKNAIKQGKDHEIYPAKGSTINGVTVLGKKGVKDFVTTVVRTQ
jgi:hypothetical protein